MSGNLTAQSMEWTAARGNGGTALTALWRGIGNGRTGYYRRTSTNMGGFTLIELLVVISIVVLLVAILLPSIQGARRKTKALVCRSNLRQWGMFFRMYTSDNDGMFHSGDISDFRHLWMEALWPYYGQVQAICLCPMATKPSSVLWKGRNAMGTTGTAWTIFTGNYSWDREGFAGSYGINGWTRNPPRDIVAQYHGTFPTANNWRQPDVKQAGEVPLFVDCRWPDGWMDHTFSPPQSPDEPTFVRFCIDRHDDGVNSLFMDWSVRKTRIKELWTLKWHRNYETRGPWTKAGGAMMEDWPAWMRHLKDY